MKNHSGISSYQKSVKSGSGLKKQVKFIYIIIILAFLLNCGYTPQAFCEFQENADTLKYIDGQSLTIIGKYHSEKIYARFPKEYKNKVRKDVWDLGQNSAGISIRFRTNACEITVRWTLLEDNSMDHMAFTGKRC